MVAAKKNNPGPAAIQPACYHCGIPCLNSSIPADEPNKDKQIFSDEKHFCCDGCKLVYEILRENGLCDYYKIRSHPGLSQIKPVRDNKYAYLDHESIARKCYTFTDGNHTIVKLYIPGIHCSSCMWLLEHLCKINPGITESRLNFSTKEVTIHFRQDQVSFRAVVELLTTIGYEPYISLEDTEARDTKKPDRKLIYKLGVAGFCFGNIMMLSFPEYLSGDTALEHQYALLFRVISLLLSLPVFFYSASEFFSAAWAGLRQKILNIDVPIALALIITYARSLYEIAYGIGNGYLDSMSGIVFFMLVGRIVQERTYRSITFHRDYKSYFPIAVDVVLPCGKIISKSIQDLKEKDQVQVHYEEVIPADAIVLKGTARIDYSFVTGESEPVTIAEGGMVYAGGKQTGGQLTIQVLKPVAGSYLTSLWNHHAFKKDKIAKNKRDSRIHKLSTYFTYILFALAAVTAGYWSIVDPSVILPSVSAMLIVACPCALLLAVNYTNGNLLRILSNNGLFLRDAVVIEQLGQTDHIVFDKTGTLTQGRDQVVASGAILSETEKDVIYSLVVSSKHPHSKALAAYLGPRPEIMILEWREHQGKGIEAIVPGGKVRIGSASFAGAHTSQGKASVYARIRDRIAAFHITPKFREATPSMIGKLRERYSLSLLSGDHDLQKKTLRSLFGADSTLLFEQDPMDKLHYIAQLQKEGKKVLMIGDGLNDAGALQQSDVGITLADDVNNFTPACDAILDVRRLADFPSLLKLAKAGKKIINVSFIVSILYNMVGLFISVQGKMIPMIAAILMPLSTLSIVLLSTGAANLVALKLRLTLKNTNP